MGVTYSVANNRITVTGYTLGAPCNFNTLYTEDKAGTLSLHARTGITGTDGAVVATDRAERPADYVVLGGASNDLYITIANWVGTTATIRITGTDRDGVAQTEDIVVTANGNYSTTKWFKTITHTQVTVFTATSFDYDLIQGQWGVVWKQQASFYITAHLYIGTGSATWFKDTAKNIFIDATSLTEIRVAANAYLQLGNKDGNGNTTGGCRFTVKHSDGLIFDKGGAGTYLYDSYFDANLSTRFTLVSGADCEIINCVFAKTNIIRIYGTNSIVRNMWHHGGNSYGFNPGAIGEINNIRVYARPYGIYVNGPTNATFWNVVTENITSQDLNLLSFSGTMTVIDCTLANWTINYVSSPNAMIVRKNTFNLKLLDKEGNNINGAKVYLTRANGDQALSDPDGGETYASTTAGKITQQIVTVGYYEVGTGDNLQPDSTEGYGKFILTISKAGYKTYEKKFTLDEKITWRIALSQIKELNFSKFARISVD